MPAFASIKSDDNPTGELGVFINEILNDVLVKNRAETAAFLTGLLTPVIAGKIKDIFTEDDDDDGDD